MQQETRTEISILVVGAGIAGLSFAIEAHRKGHDVAVIERRAAFEGLSDMVAIQPSALRTPNKWPGFKERVDKIAWNPVLELWRYDGEHIDSMHTGYSDDGNAALPIPRADFHAALQDTEAALGISVKFSTAAVQFVEDTDSASVRLRDGQLMKADVVVAADGWRSTSRLVVPDDIPEPISTGYSIYRAAFTAEKAMRNPVLSQYWGGVVRQLDVFLALDAHAFVGKSENLVFWTLTRRDEDGIPAGDLADFHVSIEKALKQSEGWTQLISELMKETPNRSVMDWKLTWRDPDPRWCGRNGRFIQIGDAAHTFLPTSASGATMAMEDAFTLASTLALAGKADIALAAQVYINLRFERVTAAQKIGIKNRGRFHHLDWDEIQKDPSKIMGQVPGWISSHDPEQYALDNFAKCAECLRNGTRFRNSTSVPGYEHKHWTMAGLMEAVQRGEKIIDEGDWS